MIEQGSLTRQTQKQNTRAVEKKGKIASEQTNSNDYLAQAVAKVARLAIQTLSMVVAAKCISDLMQAM